MQPFWQLGQIKLCENVGLACIYGYEHLAHNLVSVHNIKSVLLYTLNYKIVFNLISLSIFSQMVGSRKTINKLFLKHTIST